MRVTLIQDFIDFCRGKGCPSLERKKWIKRHSQNNSIIVIGDSHTYYFSGQEVIHPQKIAYHHGVINSSENLIPEFSPIHIGPVLAYNANKYETTTRGKEKIDYLISKKVIKRGDPLLFCYGEIDIRNHVVRQARDQGVELERVIDRVLANYLAFLVSMQKEGYQVACWGPTPSFPDREKPNKAFPTFGDEITRNKATLYFNERLKIVCLQSGIGFISIAEKVIDEHGRIKQDYFVDGCHLSQKAWALVAKEQVSNAFREIR